MSDRKTALNQLSSAAEDEQLLDLDSVLEEGEDAAPGKAHARNDDSEQMSVLDAHEEPTKPGQVVVAAGGDVAEINADDLPPIEDYAESSAAARPTAVAHAVAPTGAVPAPARARHSTGIFPPEVRSPYEDSPPPVAAFPPPVQARMTPAPAPRANAVPIAAPTLAPTAVPLPMPAAPLVAPPTESFAGTQLAPASAPRRGTVTLRVSTVVAAAVGCFASGALVCLAISAMLPSRPAPAASVTTPAAAPEPVPSTPPAMAAPLPVAPAEQAHPEAVAQPTPRAATSQPTAADAPRSGSSKAKAARRATGPSDDAGPSAQQPSRPRPEARSESSRNKPDSPGKGKTDWEDPFAK